jgi:molecular chaperone DnaK (HSP70)
MVTVGDEAIREAGIFPEGAVERIKDHMGETDADGNPYVVHRVGKDWTAVDVAAIILRKVASNVSNQMPGRKASSAVITVPAYFSAAQREATRQAAEAANLNVIDLLPEPAAAALAYSIDHNEDQTVLVYDLGGGTFDTTVINIKGGNVDVVCTDGSRQLGGWMWNDRIKQYMKEGWQKAANSSQDPLESPSTDLAWSLLAEQAKRTLTQRDSSDIYCSYDGTLAPVQLTRETFDGITSDLLEQTVTFTNATIKTAADKGFSTISKILLVGGSTYMRQVREAVEERFGLVVEPYKPDLAVVLGAAKYANDTLLRETWRKALEEAGLNEEDLTDDQRTGLEEGIELPTGVMEPRGGFGQIPTVRNVSSKNFGTVTLRGEPQENPANNKYQISYLIKKNSPVPADVTENFATSRDNQKYVTVEIIESDADDVPDSEPIETDPSVRQNYKLPSYAQMIDEGEVELSGDSFKGSPISIRFQLDRDGGRLIASGHDEITGNSVTINMDHVGAIKPADLERSREELDDTEIR